MERFILAAEEEAEISRPMACISAARSVDAATRARCSADRRARSLDGERSLSFRGDSAVVVAVDEVGLVLIVAVKGSVDVGLRRGGDCAEGSLRMLRGGGDVAGGTL